MVTKIAFDSIVPDWLFELLDEEFKFGLDVCCDSDNCKCETGIYKNDGPLTKCWTCCGNVWMFPPPSADCALAYCKKALEEMEHGVNVVALLPDTTHSRWFAKIVKSASQSCMNGNGGISEIRFLTGGFVCDVPGETHYRFRMGAMVVVFDPEFDDFCESLKISTIPIPINRTY